MCVYCARPRASVRICPGHNHNSYIVAWISNFFDTVVVLEEEKCHLKHFFLGRLKVKVTLEGHINELFCAITHIYRHGFQNNFAQVFSLKSRNAIWNIYSCTYTYPHPPTPTTSLYSTPPPPPPPPNKKKKVFCQIRILCQCIEKYLPLKKMDSLSNKFTYHQPPPPPPPTRPDHTHLPHTPPIFFIWIICQLDSVLVNFLTNWQRIQI